MPVPNQKCTAVDGICCKIKMRMCIKKLGRIKIFLIIVDRAEQSTTICISKLWHFYKIKKNLQNMLHEDDHL